MALESNMSDDELVKRLQLDNEVAFTEIYNRYWKLLFYTAHNVAQNEECAQDVVQNVFLSLWHRRFTVEIRSLKAYLQQATRYAVLKCMMDMQGQASFHDRLTNITTEIIEDDPLIFKEKQELLKELLEALPDKCSTTYFLSREEGLTYKQIASRLEISEKTVEKRMTMSLKFLRAGLKTHL